MSIFKRLFGKKTERPQDGPMPTRPLNLQHAILPEHGEKFAAQFVASIKSIDNIDLDYSPKSVALVDEFLQRFTDEGLSVNDFAETIFVAGCYVGEVMVRNANGKWISNNEMDLPPAISPMPIVIKFSDSEFADPITKAYKRFYFGESDKIEYFYHSFTDEHN